MKVKTKITIVVTLIVMIFLTVFLAWNHSRPEKIGKDIEDGTVLASNENKLPDGVTAIPAIEDFTVSQSLPNANVYNPKENEGNSYLTYEFKNADTGEIIHKTDLIKPGEYVSIEFGKLLDTGNHNVDIIINSFSYQDSSVQKNGAVENVVVTVK